MFNFILAIFNYRFFLSFIHKKHIHYIFIQALDYSITYKTGDSKKYYHVFVVQGAKLIDKCPKSFRYIQYIYFEFIHHTLCSKRYIFIYTYFYTKTKKYVIQILYYASYVFCKFQFPSLDFTFITCRIQFSQQYSI